MHSFPEKSHSLNFRSPNTNLILFSIIIFIYSFGDAIMSFMAPNIIENFVQNTFFMGLIFSASSFVGYFADLTLGNLIKEKSFVRYLGIGIILAVFFPLILLVTSPSILMLLLSMIIWGLYYELVVFSKSDFIHHSLSHDKHDVGWVTINAFANIAYILGPSAAVLLLDKFTTLPLITAIVIQVIAFSSLLIFRLIYSQTIKHSLDFKQPKNIRAGFSAWKIFNHKLWPILLFMFSLKLIDATFWTVGALLVSEQNQRHPLMGLLFVFYLLPSLLISPFGVKLSRLIGKKRASFIGGILAGLAFATIFFVSNLDHFLYLIVIGSFGMAVAVPEINGAVEDYCERLGDSANSLVGLIGSIGSLAYVIGPILAGGIAALVGETKTFAIIGGLVFVTSCIGLIFVPRKIRLPQSEIKTIFES